jgi:molecular chaperone GrpE (heat shock protein)
MLRKASFIVLTLLVVALLKHEAVALEPRNAAGNESPSKTYEDIEQRLKELMEEMQKLEKEATEKIRKELLPLLKKEIERLRKWLRDFYPDDDPGEPVKVWT